MLAHVEKLSITDRTIESIRNYIQEPGRMPGEKLPTEHVLCEKLGVGRSTVREALRVLQTMGYINIVHGRGTFIKSLIPSSEVAEQWFAENSYALGDIYAVRLTLEPLIARKAAERITDKEISNLTENLKRLESAVKKPPEQSNPNLLAQLDQEFHMLICQSTQNNFLVEIYRYLCNSLSVYRVNSFSIFKNQLNVLVPHQKILDALMRRDAEAAESEMNEHMIISRNDMRKAAGIAL